MAATPFPITTKRLFCIFAARRSGQHAIIWWLRAQTLTPQVRINNCSIPQNGCSGIDPLDDPPSTRLHGFFANFEDRSPEAISELETNLITGIAADTTTFLLILRDPFNNLASKRQANPERDRASLQNEADIWKTHAREYLRETQHLPGCVTVNYNAWFSNPGVREQLSTRLQLDRAANSPQALRALQEVPGTGQSQFDRRNFHGRAQSMPILDRWRTKLNDPVYCDVCSDEELWYYSDRIFGPETFRELSGILRKRTPSSIQ